jgi:hypothetical protein
MANNSMIERTLAWWRIDWKPTGEPPSAVRALVVTVLAVGGSLGANALFVALATYLNSALKNYSHFHFNDYGTLTAAGVVVACAAWFVVLRISSSPRWLFFRLAVFVTLVLWIPDLYLFTKHEPRDGIIWLMFLHLAATLVTYNVLVRGAPARPVASDATVALRAEGAVFAPRDSAAEKSPDNEVSLGRPIFVALLWGVILEFIVGVLDVIYVPFNRPSGWMAHHGEVVYLVHALLGVALALGALYVLAQALTTTALARAERGAAIGGLIGIALGGVGGVLCYEKSLRLYGVALMFLGATVAFFCYLVPLINDKKGRSTFPAAPGRGGHQRPHEP